MHPQALSENINRLKKLVDKLINSGNDNEALEILNAEPCVEAFLSKSPHLRAFLEDLRPSSAIVIKSVLAIGQGPIVFQQMEALDHSRAGLEELVDLLLPVEKFYRPVGGIAGYHLKVLSLIAEQKGLVDCATLAESYQKPKGVDLSNQTRLVKEALRQGIESLPRLAEIYPVGGAGDRLQLKDKISGEFLPVAQLQLCGIPLLEWLVRDLQAREFLYYKLTGHQTITPIAMMTSHEKNNQEKIVLICEAKKWFGRPKGSFRLFTQPLVPMISEEGDWCLRAPFKLMLKPGGHGVVWRLAQDEGIFSWFEKLGRDKVLVRQINNPIAGADSGLLAFAGVGFQQQKDFGFSSCFRALNTAEGVNVLLMKESEGGYDCCITNIEYTDFSKKGIEDVPAEPGSKFSAFPANTNILFADVKAVEKAVDGCPIPGMIINLKNAVECLDAEGKMRQVKAGRLESTMQNIADHMTDFFQHVPDEEEQAQLKTYVTYNQRQKTISVTKKSYVSGQSILETPEGCYYDMQYNAHDLLANDCSMAMPRMPDPEAFMTKGPSFLVHLHPALGPLFGVIASKIRGGALREGAELTIEAAEVDLQNIDLTGSLVIKARNPFGHRDADGQIVYSDQGGKCTLKNVAIRNKGIDMGHPQCWWQGGSDLRREEVLEIVLHGDGEFFAENILFEGGRLIEVPAGCRVEALSKGDSYELVKTKIAEPTWFWKYAFNDEHEVVLRRSGRNGQ